MSGLRKFLLLLVAVITFSLAASQIIFAPAWQVKKWPETAARNMMIDAHIRFFLHPSQSAEEEKIRALNSHVPGLEESIFQRVLVCLGITLLATGATGFGAAFLSFKKADGRIRGARLFTSNQLKRLIWYLENKHKLALAGAYSLLFSVLVSISLWRWVSPVALLPAGAGLGLTVFFLVEYFTQKPTPKRIHIGGVPMPEGTEARHLLVQGTPGSGKSQAIYQIVKDARSRGDRGFLMDIGGQYRQRFAKKGDLILSPDANSPTIWNPFLELRTVQDAVLLAHSTIPEGAGEAKGWHDKARALLASVIGALWASGEHNMTRLIYLCCTAEADELVPYLAGSTAATLTQKGNETPFQNTRIIISTYLQPWSYIADGGTFSVRDWIRNRCPGQWVFVVYNDSQLKATRPLLATWLDLAVVETLSLTPETSIPTWFIADEFDSLGQVNSMQDALTKLRKYQGRCVLGVQTIAQLNATNGRDRAQVLLSSLGSKLVLRAGDHETADYCSKALGEQELLRQDQSKTRRGLMGLGGDPSKSLAERHVTERIVMAGEISTVPDLVGWLALAGDWPVAKVKIPIPKL